MQLNVPRYLFSILSTFLCFSIDAGQLCASSLSPYRFGIGLGVEASQSTAHLKHDFSGRTLQMGRISQAHKMNKIQLSPSLEFGGRFAEQFYVGAIFSYRYLNVSDHNRSQVLVREVALFRTTTHDVDHHFKATHSLDALIKLGVYMNQSTMLYGKVGPSFLKYKHQSTFTLGANECARTEISKNALGLSFGVGLESPVTEHLILSIDCTYSLYKKQTSAKRMTYTINMGVAPVPYDIPITKSITPSTGTLALRLTHFF